MALESRIGSGSYVAFAVVLPIGAVLGALLVVPLGRSPATIPSRTRLPDGRTVLLDEPTQPIR